MRVESHDVRQRKVRDRRNEIDRVEGARAVDVEEHALVPDRVPRQSPEGYAGQDLDVLVVEHQLPRRLDRIVVLREIRGAISLVRRMRGLPLLAPHEVMGAREGRAHRAVLAPRGSPAAMIEVEVGGRDSGDVLGLDTQRREILEQRLGALHGEDVAKLRIVLRADAGIHQHVLAVPFDKETVHREADSISLVGGSDLVPEHLGDDAEHGAAVQAESAARNEVDLVRSDLYAWNGNDAGVPHKPSSVGFLRGDHFSGTSVTGRLKQPTRESSEAGRLFSPIWSFSRWGLPSRRRHRLRWCALTAPFHPYRGLSPEAVYFLWHFPWDRSRWGLPSTLPCGARTFLRPRERGPRPPVALRPSPPACYAENRLPARPRRFKRRRLYPTASKASFASSSARVFCSRRTWRMVCFGTAFRSMMTCP